MEENFKENNAEKNLLSQSYLDGIQKVTGNDRASLLDFQIPGHILEKRKNDWNALFEKYSSNVYEEQDEPESLQQEKEGSTMEKEEEGRTINKEEEKGCTTKNNQRFPMRKPMSMVQYWVNTGNQPYATNNLEKSQSESGSSLAEEYLETVENINSPCQMLNTSLEKNHETNETNESSRKVDLRLASSSGSSVDTVAYILANNNTTKKADTIAIMEGSKIVNSEPLPSVAINDIKKVNLSKKNGSFLDNMLYNFLKSTELDINISKNINKNVETVNNVKSLQNKSQKQEDCCNDSDESIFKSKYDFQILSQNSVEQNSAVEKSLHTSIIENKTFKRKKLYNNSESPAEFTPVSEDNTSQLTFRRPIKKCEHPALETPRISSRPSYLVKYQRLKLRSKRKSRISHSFKLLQSQKNGENLLQDNSQAINEVKRNYSQNLIKTLNSSKDTKTQELCKRDSNSLNKNLLNNSKYEALNLKPLVISLQRLPYKYDSIEISSLQEKQFDSLNVNKSNKNVNCAENNSQSSSGKKSHELETKTDNFKNLFNSESKNLTSNSESDKIDFKSPITKSRGFSSEIQKSYCKKSINYIIDFSSDDETELSVLNTRQRVPKLSKESSRIKNSVHINNSSEKKLVGTDLKVDDVNNKIAIFDTNKIKNEKKKNDLKRKSDSATKLVQSGKNRITDISCKSLLPEKNTKKSNSEIFSFSKETDKKLSLMSSDEETIIVAPTDSLVPNKFFEKSKKNLSPCNKALKEKFDQTSSNLLHLNEEQKSSSNEEKIKASETKFLSIKKSAAAKNLRRSKNISSSSDEDLQLPIKPNFNCKPKPITSTVKGTTAKSSSATTEEAVTDLIDDLSVKKNEIKVNRLEERINKIKMENRRTLLNSDNNCLKTRTQTCLKSDSSEEENFVENKSLDKEIVKKKTWQSKNKRSLKDNSELSSDKLRNKKDREKSKKEYLSSKKPKRKSDTFMSSDEECVIPLKIKLT